MSEPGLEERTDNYVYLGLGEEGEQTFGENRRGTSQTIGPGIDRAYEIVHGIEKDLGIIMAQSKWARRSRDKEDGKFGGIESVQFRGMGIAPGGVDNMAQTFTDRTSAIRGLVSGACKMIDDRGICALKGKVNVAEAIIRANRRQSMLLGGLGEVLNEYGVYPEHIDSPLDEGDLVSFPAQLLKFGWPNINGNVYALYMGMTKDGERYFEFDLGMISKSRKRLFDEDVHHGVQGRRDGGPGHMMGNVTTERRIIGFTMSGDPVYSELSEDFQPCMRV